MKFDASRVAPRLYVGSFPGDGPEMFAAAREAGFHRVIRVAEELPHEYAIDDIPLSPHYAGVALGAASEVAQELAKGKRVLVTCQAGINRSALVAGLAMVIHFRCSGVEAIARIRKYRKPHDGGMALRNTTYRNFLACYA